MTRPLPLSGYSDELLSILGFESAAETPNLRIIGRPKILEKSDGPTIELTGPQIPVGARFDLGRFWGTLLADVLVGRDGTRVVPLSEHVSATDLDLARSALEELALALLSGDRGVLDRLPKMEQAIRGRPQSETERLAQYREHFTYHARLFRMALRGDLSGAPDQWLAASIQSMADRDDPAFRKLSVKKLGSSFRDISTKAGPGETGMLRAAAEIAVEVEAFEIEKTTDFVADAKRMMSRMRKATSDAKRKSSFKKALPQR